jgi:hypothetical protein
MIKIYVKIKYDKYLKMEGALDNMSLAIYMPTWEYEMQVYSPQDPC